MCVCSCINSERRLQMSDSFGTEKQNRTSNCKICGYDISHCISKFKIKS